MTFPLSFEAVSGSYSILAVTLRLTFAPTALRYGGFVRTVDAFKKLGLLSMEPLATKLESWEELVDQVLGTHGYRVVNREERKAAIAALVGDDVLAEDVLATLEE